MKQIKFLVICMLTVAAIAITSCSLVPQHNQESANGSNNAIHGR
jgi:hypothetical protein